MHRRHAAHFETRLVANAFVGGEFAWKRTLYKNHLAVVVSNTAAFLIETLDFNREAFGRLFLTSCHLDSQNKNLVPGPPNRPGAPLMNSVRNDGKTGRKPAFAKPLTLPKIRRLRRSLRAIFGTKRPMPKRNAALETESGVLSLF